MAQDTQFRALLEGSPDAIVMVDAEGAIRMANARPSGCSATRARR